MPIQLDADLPAPLVPLAWLVGVWAGAGVVGYPSMADTRFGQEITLAPDGGVNLAYSSRTWLLADDGSRVRTLTSETGYWRPGARTVAGGTELEVLLAHPSGVVEIYLGAVDGPRVTLATDVVARTGTAPDYTAATRMYGLVEGDLLWVMEMAAGGSDLTAHASARLKRVGEGSGVDGR